MGELVSLAGYADWLAEVKARVVSARQRCLLRHGACLRPAGDGRIGGRQSSD